MNMKEIIKLNDLLAILKQNRKTYILLWKKGSELSECAYTAFRNAAEKHSEIMTGSVDVSLVRDIHSAYGVSSAPALLQFEGTELKNVLKGCHHERFFSSLLEEAIYQSQAIVSEKPAKSVTVYSTPTCSWCNTLKQWLRKNHVSYSDIDISKDANAAQDLVRRSGQQGVPQTEINGQIVVGFDQSKLKQLLEL
jgi:glutaredoxin-like YruB-family protein